MASRNLEAAWRWFATGAAAAVAGDPKPLRELIHPDFEFAPHITGGHEGVEFRGYEGFVSFLSMQAETWESLRAEPSQMRENGDMVVVVGTLHARGRGSGVDVEEPTVWLCRFRDGRMLRLEAHTARDPAQVAWALAQAGLPPDAFDDDVHDVPTHGSGMS
jgi:ketosteroid isomerase-like protein